MFSLSISSNYLVTSEDQRRNEKKNGHKSICYKFNVINRRWSWINLMESLIIRYWSIPTPRLYRQAKDFSIKGFHFPTTITETDTRSSIIEKAQNISTSSSLSIDRGDSYLNSSPWHSKKCGFVGGMQVLCYWWENSWIVSSGDWLIVPDDGRSETGLLCLRCRRWDSIYILSHSFFCCWTTDMFVHLSLPLNRTRS